MIVKVQRPVAGTGRPGEDDIMVYGEGRSRMTMMNQRDLPAWLRAHLVREPKVFVEATIDADGWTFHKVARWQSW